MVFFKGYTDGMMKDYKNGFFRFTDEYFFYASILSVNPLVIIFFYYQRIYR